MRHNWVRIALIVGLAAPVYAQDAANPFSPLGPPPARSPREGARVDLTGYWVSIVSEDWRFRMVRAPKGDYPNVPLNPEGRKIADAWTASEPENVCKSFGAANIMRQPGRLHITWADDRTLKIETDAGTQTRLLQFSAPPGARPPSRQGVSVANWEGRASLKVITRQLLPGYLQTNGVPHSGNATMTEYFDVVKDQGEEWLIVNAIVEDPTYLARTFVRSTHFRKQKDANGWEPTRCVER